MLGNGSVVVVVSVDAIEITLNDSGIGYHNNKSDKPAGNTVRISELSEDRREAVIRGRRMVESTLRSHCQFVDRSVLDPMAAISKTGAGRPEGHNTGNHMRYGVIILCAFHLW